MVRHSQMARRRLHNGQLAPLVKRMTQDELNKRAATILARRTIAEKLARNSALAIGRSNMVLAVLGRGFFGRLKWLLIGR